MNMPDKVQVNINREEAADIISQLVLLLERNKRSITLTLSHCPYSEDMYFVYDRQGRFD